jgi:hypothetical protein
MKIFKKKSPQWNPNNNPNIYIVKIFLDSTLSNNEILLDTIDYDEYFETKGEVHWDDFIDGILNDLSENEFFYVVEYNKSIITITSDLHPEIECFYKIYWDNFCKGLEVIANENDFSFLEDNLIKLEPKSINVNDNSINNLPEITDYISQHPDAFKIIYYPGACDDFTALQLFARYANTEKIIFTDYFNAPETLKIRERLDDLAENIVSLSPQHFNKRNWIQFWPQKNDNWENKESAFNEEYYHPNYAWGRLIEINPKSNTNKKLQFYYLGTEAVKTAAVLIDNNIYPELLVLQDHGFAGNWTEFGKKDFPLHETMKNHLPEYILLEPEGNTKIWPGYLQVTKPYDPGIINANSAYTSKRALYKRVWKIE